MNDLAYKVFCRLREKNLKISAAESCTGGLFTKLITDIPGSSEVLDLSIVTYANAAKVKFLGVSEKSIADHGVVSEEVAVQMARGICDASGRRCAMKAGYTRKGCCSTATAKRSGREHARKYSKVCSKFCDFGRDLGNIFRNFEKMIKKEEKFKNNC